MLSRPVWSSILRDDTVTRGLGDAEARILMEWLVEQADSQITSSNHLLDECGIIERLCQRGRAIGRFVRLWSQPRQRGAAAQLAAVERFTWPLPQPEDDPCQVMSDILFWESDPSIQTAQFSQIA